MNCKLVRNLFVAAAAGIATLAVNPIAAQAASHSDAPLIKQDPQANITDVYSFIGLNQANEKVLNVIVHVRPFSEPGDGVMYDRFADDAQYSIHIADATSGITALRYDFRFSPVTGPLKNPNTILSYGLGTAAGPIGVIGDAQQNFVQIYSVSRVAGNSSTALNNGPLYVGLPNVGKNVTPAYNDANGKAVSGAASYGALDNYTKQAIFTLPSGITAFAGPREDGFFADTAAIFDLLDVRILDNNSNLGDGLGQDGNGVDGFKGFNVLAYALQIPVAQLQGLRSFPKIGVFASVSRPRTRTLNADGTRTASGPFVQVNRMGNPLFNEVLVALKDKDLYNRSLPSSDGFFTSYAANPEIAALINFVYSTTFATTGRTDLVGIFIPDVLRVDASTEPVRLAGQPGFSRLSFIGGDTTANGTPSGWPNGRRLGDDVVDIALTAVASGPSYSTITVVGDNVAANDQLYHQVFPYSGTPHAGPTNKKDSANP